MNKKELVRTMAERTGLKQSDTRKILDAFVEVVEEKMLDEERIFVKGLGVFSPFNVVSRPVRNLSTGESMMLTPHNSMKFRPGDDFVRKLNKE